MSVDGDPQMPSILVGGTEQFTPHFVASTFRTLLVSSSARQLAAPELDSMHASSAAIGIGDCLCLNGLCPSGKGVSLGLWVPEPVRLDAAELADLRRVARHLGAAHRCRRRLREEQRSVDPWTLVDHFERDGARYVVARENQAEVQGLLALSERERQVVVYAALGQSTKETAYVLGISDTTVRVHLVHAAKKLGVRMRGQLLRHPEVRALLPQESRPK
jgi:DNA-binding CsgD family transcriptional regulator